MEKRPKGTYDILPEDCLSWQELEADIRQLCKEYNYKEIRTPIFETSSVFHRDVADTTDIVTKETYDFLDRGGRQMTLRPEGTAGVVRAFIENKLYANNLLNKLYYLGPMFRYERPQKGRMRQFSQFGIEAFGSSSPLLDAEVITLGYELINRLGIKDTTVRINTLGDEKTRSDYKEALVAYFSAYKEELCEDCLNRLTKNPLRILDCKVDCDKSFFKNAPLIKSYLTLEAKKRFEEVLKALDNLGINYVWDSSLVRGLDYYSHTVFELVVNTDLFGAQNVIGGGGRYDELVSDLGGPSTASVGMAFGLERLLMAKQLSKTKSHLRQLDVFFIALGAEALDRSFKLLYELRSSGLSCDIDYLGRSLKSQFKIADGQGALFTCIIGDDELVAGAINVKDNTTDVQKTIALDKVGKYLKQEVEGKRKCEE